MLGAIRVKPKDRTDKLDIMSRIDFSDMYTMEYDVRVLTFGEIASEQMDHFMILWKWVRE
jgi:hypothetical protein